VTRSSTTASTRPGERTAPDAPARAVDGEPSSVGETPDARSTLDRWHIAHIQEGLRQAEASESATDEEVAAAYAHRR